MIAAGQLPWLTVRQGSAPLLLCMPHAGTTIPAEMEARLVSPWLARKDTDWWIDRLYEFAFRLGASVVRMDVSRTVIDCNRDPSGASLYPGQATTELCPTTTFDGELLYRIGGAPQEAEIAARRNAWFDPYHRAIEQQCDRGAFTRVTNGRFKGGYTTRHYGRPAEGVHALQMELACRGYLREPLGGVDEGNWPCAYEERFAAPLSAILEQVLTACIRFASAAGAA